MTDQEQQRMHPGDIGLEYVAALPNMKFTWGNATMLSRRDRQESTGGPSSFQNRDPVLHA